MNKFKTNMTLMANIFPKLRASKSVVRKISKKYRFRVPLEKQHSKPVQTLFKSERRDVYDIY